MDCLPCLPQPPLKCCHGFALKRKLLACCSQVCRSLIRSEAALSKATCPRSLWRICLCRSMHERSGLITLRRRFGHAGRGLVASVPQGRRDLRSCICHGWRVRSWSLSHSGGFRCRQLCLATNSHDHQLWSLLLGRINCLTCCIEGHRHPCRLHCRAAPRCLGLHGHTAARHLCQLLSDWLHWRLRGRFHSWWQLVALECEHRGLDPANAG
mmetsp:Transcript_54195/g.139606  ORF Transcript_54195/g.139606 Transcript_54195/m.139606 type:complete len:211 (+) Transcript_54195:66-698(+)